MKHSLFMVFDVESVGLHGEGFAFGYVVIDGTGTELRHGYEACPPGAAAGTAEGREWIAQNLPALPATCADPRTVRDRFWSAWQREKANGAVLVAECGWPVEARFLSACVDDDPVGRGEDGPYPLHDVATALLTAGKDPMADFGRKAEELPQHHPVADARQSARLFVESLSQSSLPPVCE